MHANTLIVFSIIDMRAWEQFSITDVIPLHIHQGKDYHSFVPTYQTFVLHFVFVFLICIVFLKFIECEEAIC
jgi:hypothetical protein